MQLNREALIAFRHQGGDSQETLAARAGISERGLSLIEQGRSHPRVSTIKKLADALSVPVGAITVPDSDKAAS